MWNALRNGDHVSSESTDNMRNATRSKKMHISQPCLSVWLMIDHAMVTSVSSHRRAIANPKRQKGQVYFLQDSSKPFGLLIFSTEVKSFASFAHHINDHRHDNDAELTISLHWHLMAEWNTLTVPQYELWLSDRILCSSNVIARLMTHWLGWNFFSFCAVIALPIGTHFIFDQLSWVLRRNVMLWKLGSQIGILVPPHLCLTHRDSGERPRT